MTTTSLHTIFDFGSSLAVVVGLLESANATPVDNHPANTTLYAKIFIRCPVYLIRNSFCSKCLRVQAQSLEDDTAFCGKSCKTGPKGVVCSAAESLNELRDVGKINAPDHHFDGPDISGVHG